MNNFNKTCIYHPNRGGLAYCKNCKGYLCKQCIIRIGDKAVCRNCYDKRIARQVIEKMKQREIICTICGNRNPLNSQFCNNCGIRITKEAPTKKQDSVVINGGVEYINQKETEKQKIYVPKKEELSSHEQFQSEHSGTDKVASITTSTETEEVNNTSLDYSASHYSSKIAEKDTNTTRIKIFFLSSLAIIAFILGPFTAEKLSVYFSYSKSYIIVLGLFLFILCIISACFSILYFFIKKNSSIGVVSFALFLLFAGFCFGAYNETRRISQIENNYQEGIRLLEAANWNRALYVFEDILVNANGFKDTDSLLHHCKMTIADSCVRLGKNFVIKKNYSGALAQFDKADKLVFRHSGAEEGYYLVSKGLLERANVKYKKKLYNAASSDASESIRLLGSLENDNKRFPQFDVILSDAKKICDKSNIRRKELEERRKSEEVRIMRIKEIKEKTKQQESKIKIHKRIVPLNREEFERMTIRAMMYGNYGRYLDYIYRWINENEKIAINFYPKLLPRDDNIVIGAMLHIIKTLFDGDKLIKSAPQMVPRDNIILLKFEGKNQDYLFAVIKEDTGEVNTFVVWTE